MKFTQNQKKYLPLVFMGTVGLSALILIYFTYTSTYATDTGLKVQFLGADKQVLKEELIASVVNSQPNVIYLQAKPNILNDYSKPITASVKDISCVSTDKKYTFNIPCTDSGKEVNLAVGAEKTWNCLYNIDNYTRNNLDKEVKFICLSTIPIKYKNVLNQEKTATKGYIFYLTIANDNDKTTTAVIKPGGSDSPNKDDAINQTITQEEADDATTTTSTTTTSTTTLISTTTTTTTSTTTTTISFACSSDLQCGSTSYEPHACIDGKITQIWSKPTCYQTYCGAVSGSTILSACQYGCLNSNSCNSAPTTTQFIYHPSTTEGWNYAGTKCQMSLGDTVVATNDWENKKLVLTTLTKIITHWSENECRPCCSDSLCTNQNGC